MVQEQNLDRLEQTVNAIETIFLELENGEVTVGVLKYLQEQQPAVLDLCQISKKYSRNGVEKLFRERTEELEIYRKFVDDTNTLLSQFRYRVIIQGKKSEWGSTS